MKLSEVASITQGGKRGLSGKQFVETGFPAYGAGGLNGYLQEFEFDCQAIVLSSIGARCGKCFFVEGKWISLANTQVIIPDKNLADSKFLWYQLNDENSWIRSGTGQPFIKPSDVKKRKIHLPPLPTQRAIADRLDRADALRQKDRQLLQAYDDLAQSVFVEMFGDPVRNEKGWEVFKLEDCYLSQKEGTKCGPFGSALKKEEYQENGVPVWVMDNIVGYDFNPNDCLFISQEKYAELSAYGVQNGDIIISRAGTVGKMCVVQSPFQHSIISTNLIKLSLDRKKILPLYFVRLMAYFGSKIGRLRKGNDGAFTHMNTGILNNLEVPLPPLPLQTRFAAILANIEQQKDLVRQQQVESEALFGRLLGEAFGGDPTPDPSPNGRGEAT